MLSRQKIGKSKPRAATKQRRCRQSRRERERETVRANTGAVKSEVGEAAGLKYTRTPIGRCVRSDARERISVRGAEVDRIGSDSFQKRRKFEKNVKLIGRQP